MLKHELLAHAVCIKNMDSIFPERINFEFWSKTKKSGTGEQNRECGWINPS